MWPGLVGWEGLRSDVRSVRAQSVRCRTTRAHRAHFWARGEQFYIEPTARLGGSERTVCGAGKRFCVVVRHRGSGRRCMRAAGERAGDGSSGSRSERGVDAARRACTLADGGGHAFQRGQPDVPGGEYGGHAGFNGSVGAPELCRWRRVLRGRSPGPSAICGKSRSVIAGTGPGGCRGCHVIIVIDGVRAARSMMGYWLPVVTHVVN
jgi:hypothetical protein